MNEEAAYVLEQAKEERVKFVRLWFTDILGFLKSVEITVDELPEVLESGQGFDGSSIEGFARIAEGDMVARPDPATWQVLPWTRGADRRAAGEDGGDARVARMFCDILSTDGAPYDGDPRTVLRRALARAQELGLTYYVGPEFEFFLLRRAEGEPEPLDRGGYFEMTPNDLASDLRKEVVLTLEQLGIGVESMHHEAAPSQHEIDVRYTDALTMADQAMTLRIVVKEIALRRGVYATFMPKPLHAENGSGMHVHQSLFRGEENAFYDAAAPGHLSPLARQFLAGLLRHAPEIALVTNQWVNSYKRLVPGYEAPVYVSWALTHRSDLIRVPAVKPGREQAMRIEYRVPDPACNPYLAFACMLEAGLDGVRNAWEPALVERDVYAMSAAERRAAGVRELPGDLAEAIRAAERSELLRRTLGERVLEKLLENKRLEWDRYRVQVSRWELDEYLARL
jgi:glutamine synthetase